MTRIVTLFGGLGLVLAAAPATAQVVDADVKCFITSNIAAQAEKDPALRRLAMISGIFYAGRMDARLSAAQLKTQIVAVQRSMKQADLGPVMNDCAKRLKQRQAALEEIGKSIAATAPKPPAGPVAGPAPAPAPKK